MELFYLTWFLGVTAAFVCYKLRNVGQRPKGLPPGPPTLPILGNLHLMPPSHAYHQFKKWAEEYGPIYSLIIGTQVMIVLNTDQAIKDLLDKRGNIYSSRPDMYVASTVASGGLRMLLMPYAETWRRARRLFHDLLNVKAAKSYVPYMDLESTSMMTAILDSCTTDAKNGGIRVFDHIRRYTMSLTTQVTYGFRTPTTDDPRLLALYESVEKWSELTGAGAAALLDAYPVLQSLPAFVRPLYRRARQCYERTMGLNMGLWLEAKEKVKKGEAKPCFCFGLVEAQDQGGLSDGLAAMTAGSALEAASDTTASTLSGLMQALVLYPEAQRKAHQVIDEVCGDRFPDVTDMENPKAQYIRAMVKESLRWLPTAIIGAPHAAIQDDEYMGYKIPKGATVVYNAWAVHMDPKRHRNPRVFDPSRYMSDFATSSESTQNADASQRDHFSFGAGRRVCQGMHLVDRSMFQVIARLMWAFEFSKAVDDDGKEIEVDQNDWVGGFLVQARPFPLRIKPRSEKRVQVLREKWKECLPMLDEDMQWKEVPEGMPYTSYAAASGLKGEQ